MTSLIAGDFDYDANGQDRVDGFSEAFYGRLEQFLDPAVRRSQSAWGFLEAGVEERIIARLEADLASGA